MGVPQQLAVELLDPADGPDPATADEVSELVNDVYAVAEQGMWRAGAPRTTPAEMRTLIDAGEILVARTPEGSIVGSVRLHDVATGLSEFGMLVAARDRRGLGIGRALLDEVERRARDRGHRAVQLELLVPRGRRQPSKEFLAAWYGRRGYVRRATVALEDRYQHLAPFLAVDCDLQIHRKELA